MSQQNQADYLLRSVSAALRLPLTSGLQDVRETIGNLQQENQELKATLKAITDTLHLRHGVPREVLVNQVALVNHIAQAADALVGLDTRMRYHSPEDLETRYELLRYYVGIAFPRHKIK